MKLKAFIIVLFVLLFFVNCTSTKGLYQIDCVSIGNEGYVTLKVLNLINPLEYQIETASKDAIKAILFSGYTSISCQTQKSILKQIVEIENFKKIESTFFEKNGVWKSFVRNAPKEQNSNVFMVMVNVDQLRKYLEDQKIIKSLYTGF